MKIYFMKEVALKTLKENLPTFLPYFKEKTNTSLIKALKDILNEKDDKAIFDYSGYDAPDNLEQTLIRNFQARRNGDDGENVCVLFDALKNLPPTVACDERFWAGFTLLSCWNFVRERWAMDEPEKLTESNVHYHFLFKEGGRASMVRNALSRLWWIGYLTYDETKSDPYTLTRPICEKADYILNLFERSFSNSRMVVITIVEAIGEIHRAHRLEYHKDLVREILKYVNMLGGVYVLETLPSQVLKQKIKTKASEFLNA